jgi:hypothetical protein
MEVRNKRLTKCPNTTFSLSQSILALGLGLSLLLFPVGSLLGRDKVLLPLPLLLLLLDLLLLHALLLCDPLLGLLADVVLAGLDLQIHLALLLGGREGRVVLLGLVRDVMGHVALAEVARLVVWQKPVPALVGERRVLHELLLDHELLDLVDGVHIVHAVLDDAPDFLETLVGTHDRDRVTVHEDIGGRQQLERLQCCAAGTKNTLPPLYELFLVANEVSNLLMVGYSVSKRLLLVPGSCQCLPSSLLLAYLDNITGYAIL